MERNDFFKAIKENALSGAYLLHGEEEYVKESALNRLISSIDETVRELNIDTLNTASADAVITACETMPFMSEQRLVTVRALPKDTDAEKLRDYVKRMPSQTVLIFYIKGEADGRLAFVKALTAEKRAVNFEPLSEYEAAKWLVQQASSSGVMLSPSDADFFTAYAGTDCAKLSNEFLKAAAYVGDGKSITKEIITKVVSRDVEFVVFSVLDHVLSGRVRDGFGALRGLIADGEQPMDIASLIGEKARLTLQARRLIDKRLPKDAVIKQLGVKPGYAYRVYEAARLMSPSRIEPLDRCSKALCDVATLQLTGRVKAADALEQALLILAS